jgi:hypothetical protein
MTIPNILLYEELINAMVTLLCRFSANVCTKIDLWRNFAGRDIHPDFNFGKLSSKYICLSRNSPFRCISLPLQSLTSTAPT